MQSLNVLTFETGFVSSVHETRKRWDMRGERCMMKRVGSGIISLYQVFVHVKGSLIPHNSYDLLWIITQRTRRIYVQARTKDIVRCPAYMARLCFHTYFSNLREASCLWFDSTCLVGNEANKKFYYLSLFFFLYDDWKSVCGKWKSLKIHVTCIVNRKFYILSWL